MIVVGRGFHGRTCRFIYSGAKETFTFTYFSRGPNYAICLEAPLGEDLRGWYTRFGETGWSFAKQMVV